MTIRSLLRKADGKGKSYSLETASMIGDTLPTLRRAACPPRGLRVLWHPTYDLLCSTILTTTMSPPPVGFALHLLSASTTITDARQLEPHANIPAGKTQPPVGNYV